MQKRLFLFSLLISSLFLSCAHRVEKVMAVEGSTDRPYYSMGTLEVSKNVAGVPTANKSFWTGVEVITLSLANTPSNSELIKNDLKKELARRAINQYGADGVINVKYWPDPTSDKFPRGGTIYARGEMVQYREFPAS